MRNSCHIPRLLCLLAALPLSARVRLDVQPREFTMDDTSAITLTIQGGVSGSPQLSLPEALRIVGTSRNEMIVQTQRETAFRYTLRASAPGEYIVGPYSLQLDGRTYTLEGIPLTVHPAKVVKATEDLFMKLEVSAPRALVQQPIQLIITFFSVNQIDNIELLELNSPGLDLGEWQQQPTRDQIVDGKRYMVSRYVTQAVPTSQGTYTLSPVFLVHVLEPEEDMSRNRLGMFTRRMNRRSIRLQPEAVNFEARHPPAENRPRDFAGAVGQFSLNATASPLQLRVGEPVTLRVQLNGRGNIRSLLPPSIEENDDFRVFAARLVEEDLARDGQSGRKTVEQVIIPKHAEVDRIPALTFSYFNPETWEYVTRGTSPMLLDVTPAEMTGTGGFLTGPGSLRLNLGPSLLGQDLVYLKTRQEPLQRFPQGGWTPLAVWSSVPLLLWALGTALFARQDKMRKDPALARQMQAPQRLRKHLAALRAADAEKLHETIWTALTEYLGHRYRLPPGEVDSERIRGHLAGKLPDERLDGLVFWLRRCERARFAGGDSVLNAAETAKEFEKFMLALDREGK